MIISICDCDYADSAQSCIMGCWRQGRIYVANEYPTFARIILIVCQKLRIQSQNYLEQKTKYVYLDGEHAKISVKHANSSIFQNPTVGSQIFNTLLVGWQGYLITPLAGGNDAYLFTGRGVSSVGFVELPELDSG